MKSQVDPTIPYRYAGAKEDLENSYSSPLGAATSSAVRDAAGRNASEGLRMAEAADTAASQFNAENANMANQANIAQMTSPQLVGTGGTQVQSTPFNWGGLAMQGLKTGGSLATAF